LWRGGHRTIEAILGFKTAEGRCGGVLWLTPDACDGNTLKAEQLQRSRPKGESYSRDFRGPNRLDGKKSAAAYDDHDPDVLVVGGGHAGLSIAARLKQLQVDTLVVDRGQRIGDNWRNCFTR